MVVFAVVVVLLVAAEMAFYAPFDLMAGNMPDGPVGIVLLLGVVVLALALLVRFGVSVQKRRS
jgi:hypothetical protein